MDLADAASTNRALVKVAKLYRSTQAAMLARLGLHPGQDVLLWLLGQEPQGMLINELADRLGIEPPTVTRTLTRLEGGDWFIRQPVPEDRRAVRIQLTEAGRRVLPQIETVWRRLADTAVAGFAEDERQQLVRLLERVRANLAALPVEEGHGAQVRDEDVNDLPAVG